MSPVVEVSIKNLILYRVISNILIFGFVWNGYFLEKQICQYFIGSIINFWIWTFLTFFTFSGIIITLYLNQKRWENAMKRLININNILVEKTEKYE